MTANPIKKRYKYIFFDLDHTLWDYERNAADTLSDLFTDFDLGSRGIPDAISLYHKFRDVNLALWDMYDNNRCDQSYIRVQRFKQVLEHFSAYNPDLSERLSVCYLDSCPRKKHLMPHALEVLEYLSNQYNLTVVTNGFDEIQNVKMHAGDLHRFFDHVVTSQKAGHRKPSVGIFEYALKQNGAKHSEVVMVGDNLVTDMAGARGVSIDTIFFNRDRIPHRSEVSHEISCLSELRNIL